MKAELISIGDELLIGQTINTNASWLGQQCAERGIRIHQITTISDEIDAIEKAVDEAILRADIVIITGGLGPTKDDITKHTLCSYFDTKLVLHQPTLERIEEYFSQRNRPMLEVNIKQAELPENCTILTNRYGTAAGMWFEKNGKIVISLPGVPYEMKGIMTEEAFPLLQNRFSLKSLYTKTLLTQGIGESFLAESIAEWETKVRNAGLGLAYLPSPGMVKLRLSSYEGASRADEIDGLFLELEKSLSHHAFGYGEQNLQGVVGELLRAQGKRISTVESCTGGGLASSLVSIPGSSDYFVGSLLTYSNSMKVQLAQIDANELRQYGAVSKEVAERMAMNGLQILGSDLCISSTGIAGPSGGTELNPVGTVWIAIASQNRVYSKLFRFGDNRERNIQMTILTALNLLRCELLGILK